MNALDLEEYRSWDASSAWVETEEDSPFTSYDKVGGRCFPSLMPSRQQKQLIASESTDDLAKAFASLAENLRPRIEADMRLSILEKVVLELRSTVNDLQNRQTITVPLISLEPEPLELIRQIPVVLQPDGDGFMATFFDANINASGDTQTDAVENLKDLIASSFHRFSELGEEKLGPGPRRQFAVLRSLIQKKG